MPTRATKAAWDFSTALELLHTPDLTKSSHELAISEPPHVILPVDLPPESPSKLGDFPKLWRFLDNSQQSPTTGNANSSLKPNNQPAPVYSSDGRLPSTSKHVTWFDETEASAGGDESVTQDEPPDVIVKDALNKMKKKKTARPGKKERDRRKRADQANAVKATSDVESESEILVWAKVSTKPTPAQQAGAHAKPKTPTKVRSVGAAMLQPKVKIPEEDEVVFTPLVEKSTSPKRTRDSSHQFIAADGINMQQRLTGRPAPPFTPPQPGRLFVEEKAVRDFQLRWKLMHEFPEDRRWLVAPVPRADHYHTKEPEGIHVIIDFSNISIGYMTTVSNLREKAKRLGERFNLSTTLSFDSLVLLLERGRPITKRVLGGSEHSLPAIEAAKAIGYEVNILDKVFKDRALSERERRLAARRHSSPNQPNPFIINNTTSNNLPPLLPQTTLYAVWTQHTSPNSQSPPNPNRNSYHAPAPETGKWVEQGVDEILHLKIAQSLLDAAIPSTLVVATGDAAEAEFSDGFLRMLERALEHGWHVELVGWRSGISGEYRRGAWVRKWGGRFKVVELDDWVEFLGV